MHTHSMLAQETFEQFLAIARKLLAADGHLHPALFLRFHGGEQVVTPVTFPETPEQRAGYMATLGRMLHLSGKEVDEAVLVMESWFVKAPTKPFVPPSQHPDRKEAIVAMGRNAANTHYTNVVQPFRREPNGDMVFEPAAVADYNQPVTKGTGPVGLLDYLFQPTR